MAVTFRTPTSPPVEAPARRIEASKLKRVIDVAGATVGLVGCAMLYLGIAAAIKLDSPGPVFYRQQRLGKHGRVFSIWKFRTMRVDADAVGEALRHGRRDSGLLFKQADDPRITRVGKFLRRTSLDEVPQFLNVLTGDMSLVGPRPLPAEDARYYEDWQRARLEVLPGITGLWQVSGRSRLGAEAMVKLDLAYIRDWSLGLDLRILAKTLWVVLRRDGAY